MKTLIIDPGHDYKNTWNKGSNGYYEQEGVYDMAIKAKKYAEENYHMRISVLLTRGEKDVVNLYNRSMMAVRKKADAFVSFHSNASSSSQPEGVQMYYHMDKEDGKELATRILKNFMDYNNYQKTKWTKVLSDNRLYRTGLGALREAAKVCPAVLCEFGFHTNPNDERRLLTDTYRLNCAKAVVDSVANQLNIKKKKDEPKEQINEYDYKGHWIEEEVEFLKENGILNKDTKKVYPSREITRAEVFALLGRMLRFIISLNKK